MDLRAIHSNSSLTVSGPSLPVFGLLVHLLPPLFLPILATSKTRCCGLALTGWNLVHLASSVFYCLVILMVFKSLMLTIPQLSVSWFQNVMIHVHFYKCSPYRPNPKVVKDTGHRIHYY
uniref:Uncharacterized protein n=1 Tax=Opuntia streptacantha TaxID=393608 RepID=A0A7C8YPV5_OPUST